MAVKTVPNAPHTAPISPRLRALATFTIMAGASGGRQASGGLGTQRLGSSCDWAAFPLLEAFVDAQSLVGVREQGMQRLHADQPDALHEIDQQQRGRGKLRGAESIGMKKSAQQGRPSVLPCPGR